MPLPLAPIIAVGAPVISALGTRLTSYVVGNSIKSIIARGAIGGGAAYLTQKALDYKPKPKKKAKKKAKKGRKKKSNKRGRKK